MELVWFGPTELRFCSDQYFRIQFQNISLTPGERAEKQGIWGLSNFGTFLECTLFVAWWMVWVALASSTPTPAEEVSVVRAQVAPADSGWSARRLFNRGLQLEERGLFSEALRMYLTARLGTRRSFSGYLYARGSALRLVRMLAGRDDAAAAAASLLVPADPSARKSTDLSPLLRAYQAQFKRGAHLGLRLLEGRILSVRVHDLAGLYVCEVQQQNGEIAMLHSEQAIMPFSAGQKIKAVVQWDSSKALSQWRLVAMSTPEATAWQLLVVRNPT